jgi:hypothetical protein
VVFTGEWSSAGVQNMQYAFYLKEKNDPAGNVVKVGTTRAFKDNNGLASNLSTFRIAADDDNLTNSSDLLRSAAAN